MASRPFPVPNPTLPFWRTQLHELDNYRSTEELPSKCDVLIIGAGFSGTAVAYHLLDGNPSPPSIAILEARSVCSGATGRNGGHVKPNVYYGIPKYTRMFDRKTAEDIATFEADQLWAIKELIEKENIDCDFNLTRAYDIFLDAQHAEKCKKEFDQAVAEGFPTVKDVGYLPGPAAEGLAGAKGAKAAFSFTAGSLWPYKLVTHLLSIAVKKGVNLQTNTPALKVSEAQDAEGNWTVSTDRGEIKAKKIVFTANAYTAGILPQYKEKIIPVRGICSHIAVPEARAAPPLPNSYAVRHNAKGADYQISRPDGSIVVGGGRPAFLHIGEEWYDVYDDSKLIEPAVPYFDGLMQRTYRGWEDSGAEVDHIWTGIMGYSSDSIPHVGAVPSKDGQFISAGFNGHGMPLILFSSRAVARMVREGCSFGDTGVPAPFQTTAARLENPVNVVQDLLPR